MKAKKMRSLMISVFIVGLTSIAVPAADRPNIVVIIADDMGYGDSRIFWDQCSIQTPNLERLARAGMRLTNYHVDPLCTSSRAGFLSGQGRENFMPGASSNGLMDSVKMLPQFLKENGYATGGFGKWHLGQGSGDHPLDRGFDHWIGFEGGFMPYFKEHLKDRDPKAPTAIFDGRDAYIKDWTHTTDLFADEAIEFIEASKDKPFYVHLAFNAVHGPLYWKEGSQYSAPLEWRDKIASRGVTNPQDLDYMAVVEHMDNRIGSVLDCLEKHELTNNTLVLFFSDNGALTRTYYYTSPAAGSNGALRAGKATVYEGGIRVPALVCWPGVIPAGTVSSEITCHWDFYPTVYEILGKTTPTNNGPLPFRGTSLLAHLKSGGTASLGEVGYQMGIGPNRSSQLGNWKMVEVKKAVGDADRAEQPTSGALLFDLAKDPSEQNDLSRQHPEILQRLIAASENPPPRRIQPAPIHLK